MRIALPLAVAALLGCAGGAFDDYAAEAIDDAPGARVLVLGDSVMWWNFDEEASVSHAMAAALGQPVVNLSVPGARISAEEPGAAEEGYDIRRQYQPGPWDWVVFDGGANDLGDECGCGACDGVLNEMIAPGADAGEIVDLAARIRADGAQVLLMGYYAPPASGGAFEPCADELAALNARLEAYAAAEDGVWYAGMDEVIDPRARADYDPDRIHPSEDGSRKIGELAAATIRAAPR
ncbi:MAG: SGNH/GDSL hydrolase family protein [Pseudomonadota bacterium]